MLDEVEVEILRSAEPSRLTMQLVESGAVFASLREEWNALLEAGHWAQELMRAFESDGLGTVPLGAFDDAALKVLLGGHSTNADPLYALAVGSRRG